MPFPPPLSLSLPPSIPRIENYALEQLFAEENVSREVGCRIGFRHRLVGLSRAQGEGHLDRGDDDDDGDKIFEKKSHLRSTPPLSLATEIADLSRDRQRRQLLPLFSPEDPRKFAEEPRHRKRND